MLNLESLIHLLAAATLTALMVFTPLLKPLRESKVAHIAALTRCPACLGFWVSLLWAVFSRAVPLDALTILGFASFGAVLSMLIYKFLGRLE
jgi:hypothetical protein